MAVVNAAQASTKTVADPCAVYETLLKVWERNRAVCGGERFVKDYDTSLDVFTYTNLLVPFSPDMTPAQYGFYKAEAELPGITAQFSKMIIGGLLRKQPVLNLPEGLPEEVSDWIMHEFGRDDSSLPAFLDISLWEEIQTSRAWVFVDYPRLGPEAEGMTQEELAGYKPYPVLQKAENVINWHVREDEFGKTILSKVIVKGMEEDFSRNEFHPEFRETVWVHELDESGYYQIRKFQRPQESTNVPAVAGTIPVTHGASKTLYELVDTVTSVLFHGERLRFIPAWPLNGSIEPVQPIMSPIIDKEVALYNKLSRRNHLLYGASTYTPIIIGDMTEEQFEAAVSSGLGTWLHLPSGSEAKVLETPTAALQDMDRAIVNSIEEMAKLGIRMLTPETDQSGIALEIRNAAQTAQLGSLNNKVSNTMRQVIAFMINWRYDADVGASDVEFSLSADFNPVPLGADWLRLATEWYQQGLIPRSAWVVLLKHNDILPPDYDDEEGVKEIQENLEVVMATQTAQMEAETSYYEKTKPEEGE